MSNTITTMTLSKNGEKLIQSFEGHYLYWYDLKDGGLTCGYGHFITYDTAKKLGIKAGDKITQAQADEYFRQDMKKFVDYTNSYLKKYGFAGKLNQNQFDVLVSYCYNRGPRGLIELLSNSKTVTEIGNNLTIYWGTNQMYKKGLLNRRRKEQEHFFKHQKLVVDGYWGPATTTALQRYFNTPRDGIISGQHKNDITQAISNVEFGPPFSGSLIIKTLQKRIGAKADGLLGPETVKKLQQHLGTPVDGRISKPSIMVKELQKRLNDGKL